MIQNPLESNDNEKISYDNENKEEKGNEKNGNRNGKTDDSEEGKNEKKENPYENNFETNDINSKFLKNISQNENVRKFFK